VLDELIAANQQIASRSAELKKSMNRLASAIEFARTGQARIDRERIDQKKPDCFTG